MPYDRGTERGPTRRALTAAPSAVPAGPAPLAIYSVARQLITRCRLILAATATRVRSESRKRRFLRACISRCLCVPRARLSAAGCRGHGARAVLRQGEREAGALVAGGGRAAAELRPPPRHRRQLDRPAAESRYTFRAQTPPSALNERRREPDHHVQFKQRPWLLVLGRVKISSRFSEVN